MEANRDAKLIAVQDGARPFATPELIDKVIETARIHFAAAPALPVKPDPAIALGAARALSAKPEECLYFGDSGTDMKTGKAASMRTIGVLWGYRDAEELLRDGADELIASPQEALSLTAFLS